MKLPSPDDPPLHELRHIPSSTRLGLPKDAHTQYESLVGKRVLITGGTTGLGRAMALRLSAEGAKVLIFGHTKHTLDDALEDLLLIDPEALGMIADVSDAKDIDRVFQAVDKELGGLDILINNAGVGSDSLEETPDDERQNILMVNIAGYLTCSKLALQRMKEHSHIVLIGSVSADHRNPGGSIYVATKAAIQGFAHSFRQEASKKGVKVSLIEPGKTGSDMIEKSPEEQRKRIENYEMLKAEDIAVCVEYILTQPKRCTVSEVKIEPAREPKD